LKLVTLNVDNYFFNLENHPKDEFGDYDFETPQALDLELISSHLARLIQGEEVLLPFYDFKTGHRFDNRTPMKITPGEIILIDSLHGLFPVMTESVPDELKFRIYLEPLLQLKDEEGEYVRWTDIRLIRRMLRDAAHRAYDPRQTLEHWHYVRSSEMRNIIPHINETDAIINSGMPYELPLYAAKLLKQFELWSASYAEDPLREDAYQRADRIHRLLQTVHPFADESFIPSDSVIREFIGGSSFKYKIVEVSHDQDQAGQAGSKPTAQPVSHPKQPRKSLPCDCVDEHCFFSLRNPPIPLPDKVPRHWSVHFAGLDHSLPRTIHQAAHLISPLTQENLR